MIVTSNAEVERTLLAARRRKVNAIRAKLRAVLEENSAFRLDNEGERRQLLRALVRGVREAL